MIRLVLSNTNTWIPVKLPTGMDPLWFDSDYWYYATVWLSAVERGFTEKRAAQIAEAMTNRRLYEVTYEDTLEKDISKILDELEI